MKIVSLSLNNKVKKEYKVEFMYIGTESPTIYCIETYNELAAKIITIKKLARKGFDTHKIQILSTSCFRLNLDCK